jgi:adenosylmethionine-8-amino-7-oxononanoate aminotransferase
LGPALAGREKKKKKKIRNKTKKINISDFFRDGGGGFGYRHIGADPPPDSGPALPSFVGEPVMASGGVIVPPPGYLRRICEICRRNDILFVSDEVVTGFGRMGHVFASSEVFDLLPDIITFAKGVTSGYFPLGGMMVSSRLFAEIRRSNHPEALFAHGLTYSSHPVGCAVALRNLDLLEGGILEHAREIAPYFQDRMKTLEALPLVGEVRGAGLMACVECVADRVSKNPLQLDKHVGKRIDQHCQELGLLVRPLINMCVMSPPLIITRDHVNHRPTASTSLPYGLLGSRETEHGMERTEGLK